MDILSIKDNVNATKFDKEQTDRDIERRNTNIQRLELSTKLQSIIFESRGKGIFDLMQITLEINKRLGSDFTIYEIKDKIEEYEKNFMYNFLSDYKRNVIAAVEKFAYIYAKSMEEENWRGAAAALTEIIKLQQLSDHDVYEKFGIKLKTNTKNKSEKIREQQILKLIKNNKSDIRQYKK
jgi:hypothetical protein